MFLKSILEDFFEINLTLFALGNLVKLGHMGTQRAQGYLGYIGFFGTQSAGGTFTVRTTECLKDTLVLGHL